jgi:capsular exopolysaccharide synthesis family protein
MAVSILRSNVRISPIRLSRLVDVSWTAPDPSFAARVANAWATAFIQANIERRFEETAYARNFLEQRLDQVRRRLEESERRLVGYASNQEIINIPVDTGGEGGATRERSLTAESLASLNSALAEATAQRIQAESRLANRGASIESLSNATIAQLRQRRGELAADYARMLTQFQPDYPPAAALHEQIRQLDQSITQEEGRVRSSLSNAYQDSVQRERLLNGQVEVLKQDFLNQRRRSIQYNIFQRDVDTNRELYDGLLQRYKEIGVAGVVGGNNVSVVDQAKVPGAPAYPRPFLNLLIALVVGLGIGIGLALLREQMDETLTDPADLEKQVGLPLLGAIPNTGAADPNTELKDPKSGVTEAYLSVQSSLAFSSDHGIPKSLMVTSTRPGEGKSTTARALAHSIARGGTRTVLVDADMRSPSVHGDLGLPNERGLSNYLAGTEEIDRLVQYPSSEPFAVLTAGPQPPNAAELLRGAKLDALVADLLGKFDQVIIDSPPVMGLADAQIIASRTEGTVFVLEAGGVKARIARRAIDRLRQGRARLLGTILTKFDARRAHFAYGYDYGYGYGYGRRYGDAAES